MCLKSKVLVKSSSVLVLSLIFGVESLTATQNGCLQQYHKLSVAIKKEVPPSPRYSVETAVENLFQLLRLPDLSPLALDSFLKSQLQTHQIEIKSKEAESFFKELNQSTSEDDKLLKKVDFVNLALPQLHQLIKEYKEDKVPLRRTFQKAQFKEEQETKILEQFEAIKKVIGLLRSQKSYIIQKQVELEAKHSELSVLQQEVSERIEFLNAFMNAFSMKVASFSNPGVAVSVLNGIGVEIQKVMSLNQTVSQMRTIIFQKIRQLQVVDNLLVDNQDFAFAQIMLENGGTPEELIKRIQKKQQSQLTSSDIPLSGVDFRLSTYRVNYVDKNGGSINQLNNFRNEDGSKLPKSLQVKNTPFYIKLGEIVNRAEPEVIPGKGDSLTNSLPREQKEFPNIGREEFSRHKFFSNEKQDLLKQLVTKRKLTTLEKFSEEEKKQIKEEIQQWSKYSLDDERKKMADELFDYWSEAVAKGDIKELQKLMELRLFDINSRDLSGNSLLLKAIYWNSEELDKNDEKQSSTNLWETLKSKLYSGPTLLKWVLEHTDLDLTHRDAQGYTDLEKARLMGKDPIVNYIESKTGIKSRKFTVRERNEDGSPIIKMVKIPGGTYRMGDSKKVTVTITKSFEVMSTKTTQKMWKGVVDLFNQHLKNNKKYEFIKRESLIASSFKGDLSPVEQVSYDQVQIWINVLNDLSQINEPQIQTKLKELFSEGHYLGKKYRLPTEAEWEYVARMRGLASGNYAHGNSDLNLTEYAWYSKNTGKRTHPVGEKKPIMTPDGPIYDIHGNVNELTVDWFSNNLSGGVDPQGPSTGSFRLARGGSWYVSSRYLRLGYRREVFPDDRSRDVGFRLVSDIPEL